MDRVVLVGHLQAGGFLYQGHALVHRASHGALLGEGLEEGVREPVTVGVDEGGIGHGAPLGRLSFYRRKSPGCA